MLMKDSQKFFGLYGHQKNTIFHAIAASHDCEDFLGHVEAISDLEDLQYFLQLKNADGRTCLHIAAKYQYGRNAEWMIIKMFSMGADLNAQDDTGNTILHIAVKKKDYELVDCLLLLPFLEEEIKNNDGLTAYQLAEQDNDYKMMTLFFSKMHDD